MEPNIICRFGHIQGGNLQRKISFFVQCIFFCRPRKTQRNVREASFFFENYDNDVAKDF